MNLLIKKAYLTHLKKKLINAFFSFNDPPPPQKKREKLLNPRINNKGS